MRSASVAPIGWVNVTATASLEVGPVQVFSVAGSGAPGDLQRLRERERAVDQVPGASGLGSETVSVASPAVETTFAVVEAVYSAPRPA